MTVCAGEVGQFREGRGRKVRVGEQDVAVFMVKGRFYAVGNDCPHMGAELLHGRIHDLTVECHWHHWTFDLRTGKTKQSSWACAQIFPVRVEAGQVWVDAPEPEAEPEKAEEDPWVVWDDSTHLKPKDD